METPPELKAAAGDGDEDDTASVEPSEGIDGEPKTKLGWGSDA
ncbi:hypothetical protein [Natronococcus jeotgali]|nr:hypothetical protein [Natronococcus jeotgali]